MPCLGCKVEGEIKTRDDVIRAFRGLLSCLLNACDIKHILIDNGVKYQAMFYIEAPSDKAGEIVDKILKALKGCIDELPEPLRGYAMSLRVKSLSDAHLIMFNNEYIVIKSVLL